MINPDIIGSIAATLTTVAFIPQAISVVKTKCTEGISFTMYLMFTVGVLLWLVYGVMISSMPIIIANIITFILACIILWYKYKSR
jgi:MtN3 and saliva related transmembrane protein